MTKIYYREQVLEGIARKVLTAYDSSLYYNQPRAIPIENIIEWHGLLLEFQCLRKNGRILGKTVFDDGLEAVYDLDRCEYTLLPVKSGTILIDVCLCDEASNGRLRFTCAHELAHWVIHKKLYTGTGEAAAFNPAEKHEDMEIQANILASALLMPLPQIKRGFYQLRAGRTKDRLVGDMAELFQVSRQAMRIRLESHNLF